MLTMKQYFKTIINSSTKKSKIIVVLSLFLVTIIAFSAVRSKNEANSYIVIPDRKKDSVVSVQAFAKVYSVLMSPRCVNCHPIGDIPLQGDDSHLHTMAPKRGVDGKGLYAMKCANCHQLENTPGLHKPPGSPNWHLPPANMKMVFEGKSAHELAKQLIDLSKKIGRAHV